MKLFIFATIISFAFIGHHQTILAAETRLAKAAAAAAANVTANSNNNSTRLARKINFVEAWHDCGAKQVSIDDLAGRVDTCSKPLMDILSGDLDVWPVTEQDAIELCEKFGFSERCIKETSRRCAKGIQKTIVSTIGSSVQKVRKRECARSKAGEILKTTKCIEKHQETVQTWMASVTARLNAVDSQQPAADKRINSICCMVHDIEKEIKNILDPFCPNEAKFIQRLFRAVVDNAVEIVCRQPKCNDYLKGLKIQKTKDFSGLIKIILRIVFSLDTSD